MMKNFTDEMINEIDENNMKAQQILKAAVTLMESEAEGVDFMTLVESALHFVKQNDQIFNSNR